MPDEKSTRDLGIVGFFYVDETEVGEELGEGVWHTAPTVGRVVLGKAVAAHRDEDDAIVGANTHHLRSGDPERARVLEALSGQNHAEHTGVEGDLVVLDNEVNSFACYHVDACVGASEMVPVATIDVGAADFEHGTGREVVGCDLLTYPLLD